MAAPQVPLLFSEALNVSRTLSDRHCPSAQIQRLRSAQYKMYQKLEDEHRKARME